MKTSKPIKFTKEDIDIKLGESTVKSGEYSIYILRKSERFIKK